MNAATPEIEQARSAGLRYVDDATPGITRKKTRAGFAFFSPQGKRVTDDPELRRIKSIGVPPAYEHVWICPLPNGHIQATARDAKGRKQYRYHKRWCEVRDENKYATTIAFGGALPRLRERVERDLELDCMSREKVVATVVRMLDDTLIRVGNENYARDNDSYGLTTLRRRHVRVIDEKRISLKFRGKSGVEHAVTIEDKRLAKTIARCRHLPGELLFSFLDDDGHPQPVHSDDVNAYLRETMEGDFSAKDFRTFAATVMCGAELEKAGSVDSIAAAKAAVTVTAKRLGNTPTVCRKSYVHPAVIETYLDERKLELPKGRAAGEKAGLDDDERRVLKFLTELGERDVGRERLARLERSLKTAQTKRQRTEKAA